MPAKLEQNATKCLIRLDGRVTIDSAAELKELILQSIASGKPIRLNMEAADRIDIPIYQLLLAAERATQRAGSRFSLEGTVSEEVLRTFHDAGITKFPLL